MQEIPELGGYKPWAQALFIAAVVFPCIAVLVVASGRGKRSKPTAIFFEGTMFSLPLMVPPYSTIDILNLNEAQARTNAQSFTRFTNNDDKPCPWFPAPKNFPTVMGFV